MNWYFSQDWSAILIACNFLMLECMRYNIGKCEREEGLIFLANYSTIMMNTLCETLGILANDWVIIVLL